jgi:hypothetical protein
VPTGKSFANIGILIPGTAVSGGPGPTRDVCGTAGNANQTLSIHGGRTGDMVNLVDVDRHARRQQLDLVHGVP